MQFNSLELVNIGEDGEKKGSPNVRRSERLFIRALQKKTETRMPFPLASCARPLSAQKISCVFTDTVWQNMHFALAVATVAGQ